jgi:hypothetical protein
VLEVAQPMRQVVQLLERQLRLVDHGLPAVNCGSCERCPRRTPSEMETDPRPASGRRSNSANSVVLPEPLAPDQPDALAALQ